MDIFITLIKTEDQENFAAWLNQLMQRSQSTWLLREECLSAQKNQKGVHVIEPTLIDFFADITAINKNQHWPAWPSQNCMILGHFSSPDIPNTEDIFFLEDCNPHRESGNYDAFCQQALAISDWCLFSYFTTYSSGYISLITQSMELHQALAQQIQSMIAEQYKKASLKDLRTTSFYDEKGEWLLPIILAKQNQEPEPILLCCINDLSENQSIAYHEYLAKLQYLDTIKYSFNGHFGLYQLFRVTDLAAYYAIGYRECWFVTFAGDCDIEKLKTCLQSSYFSHFRDFHQMASWVYYSCFGGGADEHHGCFYAKDSQRTQALWEALHVTDTWIEKELNRLHSAIIRSDQTQQTHWIPFLMAAEQKEPAPLLLCKLDSTENYGEWDSEAEDVIAGTCWYASDLASLDFIAEAANGNLLYQIFSISDETAYQRLLEERGAPIVQAVLSANTDLSALMMTLHHAAHGALLSSSFIACTDWIYLWNQDYIDFYAKRTEAVQLFHRIHSVPNQPCTTEIFSAHISRF